MRSYRRVAMVIGGAASLAPCAAAGAQTGAPGARAITWCSPVAADPVWERHTIYLALAARPKRRTDLPATTSPADSMALVESAPEADRESKSSPAELEQLLAALSASFATASGLDYSGAGGPGGATPLPPADARYAPTALEGALYFVLRGTGAVDSIRFNVGKDSTLLRDMAEALRLAAGAGQLPQLGSAMSVRHLSWTPVLSVRPGATWPAFTLDFPKDRPADVIHMDQPEYVDQRWTAKVVLMFLVGIDGTAVPSSIRATVPADKLPWDSDRQKRAYLAFEEASKEAVRAATFRPAEYFGCRQTTWVQQEFIYKHH